MIHKITKKSILALTLCFIMLFSIISPTVSAAVENENQKLQQEIERLEKIAKKYEEENEITGDVIDLSNVSSVDTEHYSVKKIGSDYTITLRNLTAKKLILPPDDADKSSLSEWEHIKYTGQPRKTNITIILEGDNKITGYGIAVKGIKVQGSGNLEIKALSEPKVQTVKKLNGFKEDQYENAPVTAELNYYVKPGISVETGDEKYEDNYKEYEDQNSLVFEGTGNITIESPQYHGIICNGDIKFKSGNIKITSLKSGISGHRIIVGDKNNTEFSLEINSSKEKAFYDKPTFEGTGYLIMASKSAGETYAEFKTKEDVEKYYNSYRYINVAYVNDQEAPEISGNNLKEGQKYCSLPIITVTDNTGIDSITVNNEKITSGFSINTAKKKTFVIPQSNQAEKEVVATDVLGNKSKISFTAYCSHQEGEAQTEIVKEPTCTENGSHTEAYYCTVCNQLIRKVTIVDKATGHEFEDWKIGEKSKERSCTLCGHKEVEDLTVNIEKAKITLSSSNYIYNGMEKEPTVTVKDETKQLVNGKDYTVEYINNVNAGVATAIISGKENYTGTVNKNFTIQKVNNIITAYNFTKNYSNKAQSFTIGARQIGNAKLTYSSDNKSVTVDSNGKVTIKSGFAGTAHITITANATASYNKATKQITVTVLKANNSITASSFTKNYSSKAQSFTIGAKQKGNAKLTYSSNNKKVTVNSSGKVTIAKGFIGKATITITANATTSYNKATKQITVTVNPPAIKISKLTNSGSKK